MSGGERYRNAPPVKFRQRYSRSCKGYAHGDRYVKPMKSENLFRRMLLVGVLLGTAKLVTGSDSEIGRPSLKEIRRVATENAIKSASLDIKEGGTRDSKSISRGIDFDLLTAASKGFNQEEMAAYFSAYIEKYMQEIVRLGEPLAGPIPRYGPRQQLVNAQAYLNCRFQLIRRPNDFQPHYASIKSRLNAAFSVKSCTVWSLPSAMNHGQS